MSSIRGLSREFVNYSDVVKNTDSIRDALSKLEHFLEQDNPEIKRHNLRAAEYVIQQMIDVGRITENNASYGIINEFYRRHYGKSSPFYVARNSTWQRRVEVRDSNLAFKKARRK
ncbi:hypothetical protein HYS31_05860 [Candidatus Woesearchaeota archaeon]|nr:hypothetical protein [Candidatus Woesearchaeota archaeon]